MWAISFRSVIWSVPEVRSLCPLDTLPPSPLRQSKASLIISSRQRCLRPIPLPWPLSPLVCSLFTLHQDADLLDAKSWVRTDPGVEFPGKNPLSGMGWLEVRRDALLTALMRLMQFFSCDVPACLIAHAS